MLRETKDKPDPAPKMSNQLSLIETAMPLAEIVKMRTLIQGAMSGAMKEGQHYGTIPGSSKPSLLKPGAQLLCNMFRLRAENKVTEERLGPEHKRYSVTCYLFLLGTNPPIPIAEGWGEATTMESKYRFRVDYSAGIELTENILPGIWWHKKREHGKKAADEWLSTAFDGQRVTGAKNPQGQWVVAMVKNEAPGKVENEALADSWNTVLKIAIKRAYVDATITATACNDFFTQDLEDIRDNIEAYRRDNPEPEVIDGEFTMEGAADGAKTTETKTTETGTKKTAPAKPVNGSWRTVVCHIGKARGPIKDKPLGSLDDGQRAWLLKTCAEKGERASKLDKALHAALLEWQREHNASDTQKRASDNGDPAKDGNEGVNREVLRGNLDWADVMDVFMPIANERKWTQAARFEEITEAEAVDLMARIDDVFDICKAAKASQAKPTTTKPAPETRETPDTDASLFPNN